MAGHLAEPPPVLVAALAVPAVKEALIRRLLERGLATTAADAQAMPPLVRTYVRTYGARRVRPRCPATMDGLASCDSRRG
jgi:hypothetical protein